MRDFGESLTPSREKHGTFNNARERKRENERERGRTAFPRSTFNRALRRRRAFVASHHLSRNCFSLSSGYRPRYKVPAMQIGETQSAPSCTDNTLRVRPRNGAMDDGGREGGRVGDISKVGATSGRVAESERKSKGGEEGRPRVCAHKTSYAEKTRIRKDFPRRSAHSFFNLQMDETATRTRMYRNSPLPCSLSLLSHPDSTRKSSPCLIARPLSFPITTTIKSSVSSNMRALS